MFLPPRKKYCERVSKLTAQEESLIAHRGRILVCFRAAKSISEGGTIAEGLTHVQRVGRPVVNVVGVLRSMTSVKVNMRGEYCQPGASH